MNQHDTALIHSIGSLTYSQLSRSLLRLGFFNTRPLSSHSHEIWRKPSGRHGDRPLCIPRLRIYSPRIVANIVSQAAVSAKSLTSLASAPESIAENVRHKLASLDYNIRHITFAPVSIPAYKTQPLENDRNVSCEAVYMRGEGKKKIEKVLTGIRILDRLILGMLLLLFIFCFWCLFTGFDVTAIFGTLLGTGGALSGVFVFLFRLRKQKIMTILLCNALYCLKPKEASIFLAKIYGNNKNSH